MQLPMILITSDKEQQAMNREELIKIVQSLMPGVDSSGGILAQSDCIVIKDGMAYTFNDQIAVRTLVPFSFDGALEASTLLTMLQKLDGEVLKVVEMENKVHFKGIKRSGSMALNKSIELPISIIELPKKWRPVHEHFCKALSTAAKATGKDESRYTFTCVHAAPDFVEASDNTQLIRWKMDTGIRKSILMSGTTANILNRYNVKEAGLTHGWAHFRDVSDLIYSVRLHEDEYPTMDVFLNVEGEEIVFPPDIGEAANRASSFLSSKHTDEVKMTLSEGKLKIEGSSNTANFCERMKVDYRGPDISFYVHPYVCGSLSSGAKKTIISDTRIKVTTGNFEYVAVLQKAEE
jgi:hypothetical protein